MARKKAKPSSGKKIIEVDLDGYPLPKGKSHKSIKADKCRWHVDPRKLGFKTTKEVKPLSKIVGQPRASAALKLGAQIRGKGYNIFVTGLSATGRSTAVKNILESFKLRKVPRKDHCYVNNFRVHDEPRLITLPAGMGNVFRQEVNRLVETLKATIPHALEDETVLARKRQIAEEYAKKEANLFKKLEQKVSKDNFALVQVQMGPYTRPDVFPIIGEEPVPPNQVGRMVEEGKFPKNKLEELYETYQGYKADLRAVLKKVRQLNRELGEKTAKIEKEILEEILEGFCQDLDDKFEIPEVSEYLCEIKQYIMDNPGIFSSEESAQPQGQQQTPIPPNSPVEDIRSNDPFRQFKVNVVHDSTREDEIPVIVEHHPNYNNLFGSIEREMRYGGYWTTDFTQIRGGSLLRADGGYLVINAMDVIMEGLAWRTLMRTLKTGKLQIQGVETLLSIAPATIKPEPIDIDVTVILIGDSHIYHLLNYYEDDFNRVFKVRADFDSQMPRGKKQIQYYAALASKMVKNECIPHLTNKAVARLAEQGARLSGRGSMMSARLGRIADIIREAGHHAVSEGAKLIDQKHIELAIEEAEYRQDLVRERIDSAFDEEILKLDTSGSVIGQINGLAVHDMGSFAFGRPQRITCEVSMGDGGIVNVEREAKLSGSIHDKGILIIEGFLRHMYGMERPISLSASLVFEQSYSNIDGDSASIAEIVCLLSELAGIPVRQDLAVTGSVNQKGMVQPIGGINEKVEGFFRTCDQKGLTGTQGVVLPDSNTAELMLSDRVLKAIKAGKFHLYPIKKVDEAIELFTGVAAGRKLKKGGWTRGSVHDRVDLTLSDFYWAGKDTGDDDGNDTESAKPRKKPRKNINRKSK